MTEEKALVDQSLIDEARKLSGEANRAQFDFTPIIEIDNSKIEEKVSGGRKTKVTCEPRFVFTTKNENNEYVKAPYPNPILGVVLKVRYMVDKKWEENSDTRYYRSNEFDSFFGRNVVLRSGEDTSSPMTYKEFKEKFEKKYNLWSIVYFLMNNAEGNKIYKLKLKGTSRGHFWDYMNSFGKGSMLLNKTEVSFDVDDGAENPFNFACFKKLDDPIDSPVVMSAARELNDLLNSFNSPEPTVIKETPKPEPAVVEAVPKEAIAPGEEVKKPENVLASAMGMDKTATEEVTATEKKEEETDGIKIQGIPF